MLMCTRPLVVFWWLRKNYWSYRKNNYIFGILTKFYLRKVTSYFTCRAIRGLIFSKLPPIDWSVLRSTIWNGRRYYALRCSVTCQRFSYSLSSYLLCILFRLGLSGTMILQSLPVYSFLCSIIVYMFDMYTFIYQWKNKRHCIVSFIIQYFDLKFNMLSTRVLTIEPWKFHNKALPDCR